MVFDLLNEFLKSFIFNQKLTMTEFASEIDPEQVHKGVSEKVAINKILDTVVFLVAKVEFVNCFVQKILFGQVYWERLVFADF